MILSFKKNTELLKIAPEAGTQKYRLLRKDERIKGRMGPFSTLGVKVFDDYWINYMTLEMARSAKLKRPTIFKPQRLFEISQHKNL